MAEITGHNLHPIQDVLDPPQVGRRPDQRDNVAPDLNEPRNQMRPQETGRARHQNALPG
jgi:hypothetical protein